MRLIADESLDNGIIQLLEKNGFQVYSISKHHQGIGDDEVLALSVGRKELLITEDKDFGELTIRFNKENVGIVLIRANGLSTDERFEMLHGLLGQYGEELKRYFTVLDSNNAVRMRKLK